MPHFRTSQKEERKENMNTTLRLISKLGTVIKGEDKATYEAKCV